MRWTTIAVAGALLMVGCGPPSRGEPGEKCLRAPIPCEGKRIESCCKETQCAYRVSDGADFPCEGTNCEKAANDAAAHCRG